jgi:hypothetical protein
VFSIFDLFIIPQKELTKATREDPETHDFVKRGVQIGRNEVQKVGFLGWPDEMCVDTVQL